SAPQPTSLENPQPMVVLSTYTLSEPSHPHPCFLPSAHIPPLQPTHQYLSTHDVLPTLPTKHARASELQPCQAKAPLDTPLNTKPKPALPIPLPKLPTPRQSLLSTAHAKNSY